MYVYMIKICIMFLSRLTFFLFLVRENHHCVISGLNIKHEIPLLFPECKLCFQNCSRNQSKLYDEIDVAIRITIFPLFRCEKIMTVQLNAKILLNITGSAS